MILPEKNPKNKEFASLTQIFKLLVQAPQVVKTYPIVMQKVIACLQRDSKQSTVKHHNWNFLDFFRQSVTKIVGKTTIWTIFCFSSFPPLTLLRNNGKKNASSFVMGFTTLKNNEQNLLQALLWGSQHCIRGRREIFKEFF